LEYEIHHFQTNPYLKQDPKPANLIGILRIGDASKQRPSDHRAMGGQETVLGAEWGILPEGLICTVPELGHVLHSVSEVNQDG